MTAPAVGVWTAASITTEINRLYNEFNVLSRRFSDAGDADTALYFAICGSNTEPCANEPAQQRAQDSIREDMAAVTAQLVQLQAIAASIAQRGIAAIIPAGQPVTGIAGVDFTSFAVSSAVPLSPTGPSGIAVGSGVSTLGIGAPGLPDPPPVNVNLPPAGLLATGDPVGVSISEVIDFRDNGFTPTPRMGVAVGGIPRGAWIALGLIVLAFLAFGDD